MPVRTLTRIDFHARIDAVLYLRFWKRDAGAMAALRSVLSRQRQGPIARLSDDDVIEALAVHLAHGVLVGGVERGAIQPKPAPGTAPVTGTQSPEAQQGATEVVSPAAPRSILPQLEIVQIEGAAVLPEVLETLEQLDLTLGKVQIATVSLEPTPSGVAAIQSELGKASGSISTTLDDL
jgi:hypothetical protein